MEAAAATIALAARSSLVSAIKSSTARSDLPSTASLHAQVLKSGFLGDTSLSNHLLNAYAKCSRPTDALLLFGEMPDRDLVSFSVVISTSCHSGEPGRGLRLASLLQRLGLRPNQFVLSSSVTACSKLGSACLGRQVHTQAVVSGLDWDPFVRTSLVDMYSKLGDVESAVLAFGCGTDPATVNSMVSGLVGSGRCEEALELLGKARREFDFKPTEFSFGSLIKACGALGRGVGEQVHGFVVKVGFDSNCFVGTSLVDMYGRFGDVGSSEMVFWSVSSRDLALYNAVIVGSSQNSLDESALEFFNDLRLEGLRPDECTLSSVLKACGGLKSLDLGRTIHGAVEMSEFRRNLVVNSALIDMYMKCGEAKEAHRVFARMRERNTISYNTMISGLGQNGNPDQAVSLFNCMNHQQLDADRATFVALAGSCPGHEWGVYAHVIKCGFRWDLMIENVLLDALFKRGAIEEALEFFDKMREPNVVSWTTVISGLNQLGFHSEAMEQFRTMRSTVVSPNTFTFSSCLKACGSLADLEQGRCVHACTVKHGAVHDEFTSSSILDMYARCGALEESCRLFDELPKRDVVSWNTMITAYSQHGCGWETLELYARMEAEGVDPNQVTFVSLLSACGHRGLVDDGVRLFELMISKHRVVPCLEHYACMVDMFGRAGMLDRAKCLIDRMPFEANAAIWMVFMSACRLHGNVELAKLCRDHLVGMASEDEPALVLMSNIYSEVGRWEDAEKSRGIFDAGGARKEPGVSWVQIKEEHKQLAL